MDESRKAFEREYWNEFGQFEDVNREEVFKFIDSGYYRLETIMAWWAWQASRKAIEIELPEACSCCYSESEKEWHDSVMSEVTGILRAAGIKIKD